jgi:hypothetical protein
MGALYRIEVFFVWTNKLGLPCPYALFLEAEETRII